MNNSMITHNGRGSAQSMDVWSQNGGQQLGFPGQEAAAGPSPVAKVQRLLRGRVILAILLGIVGAAVGGTLGSMSQKPMYRSQGVILISPTIPLVDGDKNMPYYQQFMNTQAMTIKSPSVLATVPNYQPWSGSQFANDRASLAALKSGIDSKYERNTFSISLQYDDENKQRADIAIPSIIKAFTEQYRAGASDRVSSKVTTLENRKRQLEAEISAAIAQKNDVIKKYGSPDLDPLVRSSQTAVEEIVRELRGHENNLRAALDAQTAMKNGRNEMPVEELAQVDSPLAQMLNEISTDEMRSDVASKSLGVNHPKVKQMRIEIDAKKKFANDYSDTLRKDIVAIIPDFTKPGGFLRVTPGALRVLKTRVERLKSDQKVYEEKRGELRAAAGMLANLNTTIDENTKKLLENNQDLDKNRVYAVMSGDLQVMEDGTLSKATADKKIMFGLVGAIVGSSALVSVLLLLGMLDNRFRYSDDAAGQSMSGVPLLGILPNLPDRLSDPAQASIAAHCVHQIRTMLQLNAMRDGSTVFAVTSASSGDGKTSLSLALGLSFAASGSRTLLIDADLIGGGLTSRLGTGSSLGIVDALAGVNLDDCSQATDVSDLAIVPIGSAQAHHAGGFSPPAVRKLLGEARKRYEVIIIDTGPVMGSIEATPICASVDGVVLTVARGQSRPLVERAITHLNSIGAHVAGVVFNRAQHKDFEQSIGAISIRSAARSTVNGTGHNTQAPGDIGAVAQAVATSVGRGDN